VFVLTWGGGSNIPPEYRDRPREAAAVLRGWQAAHGRARLTLESHREFTAQTGLSVPGPRGVAEPLDPAGLIATLSCSLGRDSARDQRDAVILWLLDVRLLPQTRILREVATLEPVLSIAQVDLPTTPEPRACPACLLTRWLHTLARARSGAQPLPVHGHACQEPVPPGWDHGPLFPSVDRWGTVQGLATKPLTRRALHDLVRARRTQVLDPAPPPTTPDHVPPPLPASMTVAEAIRLRRRLRLELDD